ncbi:carbon-monoxide dehydrogenase medium subunit [Rhizobiales bacterium GAS113]|jgi:carbon-monoxide dehydrogenase medium subunit|nr:carbon-monoxide dehydrogenase medium subunit [Rhizobiales bacterium GAS113]SEE24428.1 carbon-monoxide dehydrogenase medium subunit [Rhizobiales bacterium GAS188]
MYAFEYVRANSVRGAASALAKHEEGKILAGGHTLIPTMKQRLASPSALIDLGAIKDLAGIEQRGRSLIIGAMTTHAAVAASDVVKASIPSLAEMAHMIGDPAVRSRGTIGGSIANNDPAADYPAACIALNATIVTNKRKIPAGDFFKGLYDTALEPGEIIVRIAFRPPSRAAYMKFRNPASRFALVGVFVAKKGSEIRVAVTGAGSQGVFRWHAAEEALAKRFNPKSLEGLKVDAAGLNADIHASADYRAHLIGVMTQRAVTKALGK